MSIVNSRPLSPSNLNDPCSEPPVTPNHELTMKPYQAQSPDGNFIKEDIYPRKKMVQYSLQEQFCQTVGDVPMGTCHKKSVWDVNTKLSNGKCEKSMHLFLFAVAMVVKNLLIIFYISIFVKSCLVIFIATWISINSVIMWTLGETLWTLFADMIHAGLGYTKLNNLLSCLNLPSAAKNRVRRRELEVAKAVGKMAKECGQAALEEEANE